MSNAVYGHYGACISKPWLLAHEYNGGRVSYPHFTGPYYPMQKTYRSMQTSLPDQ